MKTRNKLKIHLYRMLIIGILLYLSAFFISSAVNKYYSPLSVTNRVKSEIASALSDLDSNIEKIQKQNFQSETAFHDYFDENYKSAFNDEGIEILIYKNDSLKFWSDNTFAAPLIKDTENFSSEVIHSGSGYYLARQRTVNDFNIIALQLIRYNYKYLNEYLPSVFHSKFSAPANAGINLQKGKYQIATSDGKFLFSLSFDKPFEKDLWLQYMVFILYLASILCLISASYVLYMFKMRDFGQKWFLFLVFVIDVLILRAIQFYFKLPADLYSLQYFNPANFASSEILPSLGDFLINVLIGVQFVYFLYKNSLFQQLTTPKVHWKRILLAALLLVFIIALFYFLTPTISNLVLDSTISFRFENVLSLSHISHIGIIILALVLFGFLLLVEMIGKKICTLISHKRILIILVFTGMLVFSFFTFLSSKFDILATLFLSAILIIGVFSRQNNSTKKLNLTKIVLLSVLLSAFATYLLNNAEVKRENEKRKLLATQLSNARDNLAEYYYKEAVKALAGDGKLKRILSTEQTEKERTETSKYIKEKYFSGYWSKYLIQITLCQPEKELNIMPGNVIVDCESYFDEKIKQYMRPVSVPGLYFLRQSVDAMYYLGKIKIPQSDERTSYQSNIFIEISSNDTWKGLGYPELLIDRKNINAENFNNYSYAFYSKGELIKNVGKYSYDIENQYIKKFVTKDGFYTSKGYSHYVFVGDANTMIVLSKEVPRISDLISPFSYIFILLMIMLLIVNGIMGFSNSWKAGIHTFRLRLQLIMIAVIVVSSILLVTVSLLFINMLNRNKNNEILSEKLNSVLIDLETRYGNSSSFNDLSSNELTDLLINLSNTYFTDINLYNTNGFLLASSRDQIFKEGMISEQMSPSSARQLMVEKKSIFIENENIGNYSFLSAYTPLRNIDNKLLGYLNLPYFAKQEEIRKEISSLISAFANIYIIMIVITVLLALLLSRYITKPLQHIGNQFSMVKIGDKNAKISWYRKDEIGRLVDEYNRMIDEMERSTELLARSERESAWRQMARQVAHEIKNPLTPIKLSMQLLMRAWNDKAPDWDIRLKRFSQTLIMQIDTLSSIATEFSDFAQMPEPQIQAFDVIPIIQQSAALFRDQSDCEIFFNCDYEDCIIISDQNQILRVFNNLIKNALQAIPGDRKGRIQITLSKTDSVCEISFQDNGTGIPTERQTRIFSPNFTTKTAGMGLGLAMVKNIIDNSSGQIWFETDPGEGTTFYVSLPLKHQEASK